MKLKHAITAALFAAAAAVPSVAGASVTVNAPIGFNPAAEFGTITYAPGGIGGNAGTTSLYVDMGRFSFSTSIGTIAAYCIDILHFITTGTFDVDPLSAKVSDLTKQNQIIGLVTHADPLIASTSDTQGKKDIAAAIQMAIWEIEYEGGNTGYSLTGGTFKAAPDTSNAGVLAANYLSYVSGTTGTNGSWYGAAAGLGTQILYSATNQSQIFIVPVPEPATWAMMIGGFGLIGGSLRAARKQKLRAFA